MWSGDLIKLRDCVMLINNFTATMTFVCMSDESKAWQDKNEFVSQVLSNFIRSQTNSNLRCRS